MPIGVIVAIVMGEVIPVASSIMREFHFPDDVVAALRRERFQHPHPRVQQKMDVLWLKSRGLPHAEIARLSAPTEEEMRGANETAATIARLTRERDEARVEVTQLLEDRRQALRGR